MIRRRRFWCEPSDADNFQYAACASSYTPRPPVAPP